MNPALVRSRDGQTLRPLQARPMTAHLAAAARPADPVRSVACPRCAATAGEPCARRGGRPHSARLKAALYLMARQQMYP